MNILVVGTKDCLQTMGCRELHCCTKVSVPFIELHTYFHCSCFGTKVHYSPTNYGNLVVQHTTAVPNIVCISHSISELQEHAFSHCSLLWYRKGIVYQQIIKMLMSNH